MSRHRRTAAALTATLAALLVTPQVLPASAAPHAAPYAGAAATGTTARALIQGVVVDQFGHPVDDVEVQATTSGGEPAASDLTYANQVEDGPQHGYFALHVTRGTYTLTLTREGYKTLVLADLPVERARQRLSLGETTMEKKLLESRTDAALVRQRITTKQNGVVTLTVSAKGVKPTGEIEIREGREVVGDGRLTAGQKGPLTVTLDRLAKGSHVLRAVYLGSTAVKASSSKTFTLVVTKARR